MQTIFIHGLGQNTSSWEETISFLPQSIQAVVVDLKELLGQKEVTYSQLYDAFVTYCEKCPEPLQLCGLSLGGILALNYTIDYPERVQSLVLIGAQYKMPKALLKVQNIIFRIMPNSTFEKMGFTKSEFIQLTNSMMDLDFSKALEKITCNTQIICGEKDGPNKKAAEGLAAGISRAELRFVARAGHEINVDNPKELAEVMKSFIVPFEI